MMCRRSKALLAAAALLASAAHTQTNRMHSQLIIVEPGHFHATLLQKEMYPWLDPRVSVYAPLGPELLDYLGRISAFNLRWRSLAVVAGSRGLSLRAANSTRNSSISIGKARRESASATA